MKPFNYFQKTSRFFSLHQKEIHPIVVRALDHDGCFGVSHASPHQVSLSHRETIQAFTRENHQYGHQVSYVTSFSNRQCIRLDALNALMNSNNLAFPVLKALARALGSYFDPLLLADITVQQKAGFNIQSILEFARLNSVDLSKEMASEDFLKALFERNYPDFVYSEDKINILYAQMHRFALLHPHDKICFRVCDDLLEQVLLPLNAFYLKHQDLVPKNITLMLNHYNSLQEENASGMDNVPSLFSVIKGCGEVDPHYYQTVNVMGEIAKEEEGALAKYRMGMYLTPQKIVENNKRLNCAL